MLVKVLPHGTGKVIGKVTSESKSVLWKAESFGYGVNVRLGCWFVVEK